MKFNMIIIYFSANRALSTRYLLEIHITMNSKESMFLDISPLFSVSLSSINFRRGVSTLAKEKTLTTEQREQLLSTIQARFEQNMLRHPNISWENILVKLENNEEKLWSLNEMERTEGEPDVVAYDHETNEYTFVDCSPESPKGRRSICYDQDALNARKKNKPEDSAINMAASMGIEILSEMEYRSLQQLGNFDLKTSSWVLTPPDIRRLGGAIFCDKRYDTVFMYHNGADSYYSARGFRGSLTV